jgi:hypothetical protein
MARIRVPEGLEGAALPLVQLPDQPNEGNSLHVLPRPSLTL